MLRELADDWKAQAAREDRHAQALSLNWMRFIDVAQLHARASAGRKCADELELALTNLAALKSSDP